MERRSRKGDAARTDLARRRVLTRLGAFAVYTAPTLTTLLVSGEAVAKKIGDHIPNIPGPPVLPPSAKPCQNGNPTKPVCDQEQPPALDPVADPVTDPVDDTTQDVADAVGDATSGATTQNSEAFDPRFEQEGPADLGSVDYVDSSADYGASE